MVTERIPPGIAAFMNCAPPFAAQIRLTACQRHLDLQCTLATISATLPVSSKPCPELRILTRACRWYITSIRLLRTVRDIAGSKEGRLAQGFALLRIRRRGSDHAFKETRCSFFWKMLGNILPHGSFSSSRIDILARRSYSGTPCSRQQAIKASDLYRSP